MLVRVRSDYALAYRYAAHCAFRVGNGVKGRDYAKKGPPAGGPDSVRSLAEG